MIYSVISAPAHLYQTLLRYLVCILVTCFHGVNRIVLNFILGLCCMIELDNRINLGASSLTQEGAVADKSFLHKPRTCSQAFLRENQ